MPISSAVSRVAMPLRGQDFILNGLGPLLPQVAASVLDVSSQGMRLSFTLAMTFVLGGRGGEEIIGGIAGLSLVHFQRKEKELGVWISSLKGDVV